MTSFIKASALGKWKKQSKLYSNKQNKENTKGFKKKTIKVKEKKIQEAEK